MASEVRSGTKRWRGLGSSLIENYRTAHLLPSRGQTDWEVRAHHNFLGDTETAMDQDEGMEFAMDQAEDMGIVMVQTEDMEPAMDLVEDKGHQDPGDQEDRVRTEDDASADQEEDRPEEAPCRGHRMQQHRDS